MQHDATQPAGEDGTQGPGRRRVMMLSAAAGLGVAGTAALTGCGSDGASSPAAAGSAAGGGSASAAGGGSASAAGGPLASLADVPVGGSYAAAGPDGKPIVISQPAAGKVVAFSAVCTHQGCKVVPQGSTLNCPCHKSVFDAFTGGRVSGPAPSPLPAVAVKVSGTEIVAG